MAVLLLTHIAKPIEEHLYIENIVIDRFNIYGTQTARRALLTVLTLMSFVMAVTVDAWHTHDTTGNITKWKKHHSESQDNNSASHNDENCPLCYHHFTKDILIANTLTVVTEQYGSDFPFFLFSAEFTNYRHTIAVRGPPSFS